MYCGVKNVMGQDNLKNEVWATVQEFNRLWTVENKADALVRFFHRDMVAISPTSKLRVEGQKACVAAWKQFADTAKIRYWKEIDPKIDIFCNGSVAVVTYYFDMAFDVGGQTVQLGGRDMFTLVKEKGRWWAVADQFSPYPP